MILDTVTRTKQYKGYAWYGLAALCLLLLVFLPHSAFAQASYTWSGGAGGDWQTASNWTPARTTTATTDILIFSNTTATVVNVPAETIGELRVTGGSAVVLQTTGATLAIGAADGLTIQDACSLTLSGSNALTVRLAGNNSNINGSGELVIANGSAVEVTGILKLNGTARVDLGHASAALTVTSDAELQVNTTGATINFDADAVITFAAATALGQQPSTLRFANGAALALTGSGQGMLRFGYYYDAGTFMAVTPRMLSGTGGDAATLHLTGDKRLSLFRTNGGAEAIDIPGDLIVDGGGTLSIVPDYSGQNVRITGEVFGTNLLTVRNGTTLRNYSVLQSSIRMAIEDATFSTPEMNGSVYSSRNISLYGSGILDIGSMNFWSYASIDLYDSSAIHLSSADNFIAGSLHMSNALNIHGTGSGNSVYAATALVSPSIEFTAGSSLNFDNNAVLTVTGATCVLQFYSLASNETVPLAIAGGGGATLELGLSGSLNLYGRSGFAGDHAGFEVSGTLDITGGSGLAVSYGCILRGRDGDDVVHISAGNPVSIDNNLAVLAVEGLSLNVDGTTVVGESGALYLVPTTTASAVMTMGTGVPLTVNGNLVFSPVVGPFSATLAGNGPIAINGTAHVQVGDGAFIINNETLTINDNPTFTATSGTVQYNGTSTLEFAGSAAHTADGELSTTALVGLVMNNSGGVTLSTNVTVTDMLTLSGGLIHTTGHTLTVLSSGDIDQTTTASYIVGNLQQYVPLPGAIFPIGSASKYMPVFVRYNDGGGDVLASVDETNPTTGRAGISTNPVQATWYLTAVDPMPSGASLGFMWPESAEPAGFNQLAAAPARWNGGAWESYRDNVIDVFTGETASVFIEHAEEFSPWAVFGGFEPNFTTQPSDLISGTVFSPDVSVEVLDPTSATRIASDNTTQITLSHSGSGGQVLTGTTTQTVVNGLATFSVGMAGAGESNIYLTASTEYNSTTSAVFSLIAAVAQLGGEIVIPSNPQSGQSFSVSVQTQTTTGSVAAVTQATVIGASYSNPYLYLMSGSTQATIGMGGTAATLTLSFYNSSSSTITTTLTITGGTLTSTTVTLSVQSSCTNNALSFSNAYVAVADTGTSSLDLTGSMTIETWMWQSARNTGSWAFGQAIAGKSQDIFDGFYSLFYDGNGSGSYNITMIFDGTNYAGATVAASVVPLNTWTHIAGVYDEVARTLTLYINGQPAAETAVNPSWTRNNTNNHNFEIGRMPIYSGYILNGKVDEVRVWNTARTAQQIRGAMYSRLNTPVPGLAGYWRFDEGAGTRAFDISGNGNHGTLNSTVYQTSTAQVPRLSGPASVCSDAPYTYTAPATDGAGYAWSATGGAVVAGQSTTTASIVWDTGATSAVVQLVFTEANGCAVSTSLTVNRYPNLVVSAGEPVALCYGQSTAIGGAPAVSGGTGSFSYAWTPSTGLNNTAIANPTAAPTTTTTYTLTATDLGNGCQISSTITVTVNPVASPAISFNGQNYINAGVHNEHKMSTTMTMEAWIRPTANTESVIINREGEYELLRFADGSLQWALANGSPGWNYVNTGYIVPLNEWTHVAVSYDNGVARTYANGTLVHTYNGSGAIGDADAGMNELRIASRQIGSQQYTGLIDEVRIWNTMRTEEQIRRALYTSLTGSEPGLALYYPFNEGIGTTTADGSANGFTGTFVNNPTWNAALRATGPSVVCSAAEPSVYVVAASAGTDYTWSVDGGTVLSSDITSTSSSISVEWSSDSGTVTVTAATLAGCSISTTITVQIAQGLAANAGTSTSVCYGGSVALGGAPTASGGSGSFSYAWTPSSGLDNAALANPTATPSTTTTYTVVATDLLNGCQISSTVTVTVNPVPSPGLVLDGTGDYIALPAAVWVNGNYTVEGWVNLREATAWARFAEFSNGISSDNIAFMLSSGANGPVSIRHFNGGSFVSQVVTPDALPLNEWVHVAFVLDGTVGRIYKNGELWAEAGGQFVPNNVVRSANYIGHSPWPDPEARASFDEIRVWNTARTQEQIQQNMYSSLTGGETGLYAYYRFDEGRGFAAADASENGLNAAIAGNAVWTSTLHLTGATDVCRSNGGQVYSILPSAGTEYEWSVSGGTIVESVASATTNTITVEWNSGVGTVAVTGTTPAGCSASTSMTVMVNYAPVVSAGGDSAIDEDNTTTVTLSISDVETAAASLVVSVTSGNPALLPQHGITLDATSATMNIALVPAADLSGTAVVTVEVSDGCEVTSTTFTLTVNAVNDAPVAEAISVPAIEDISTTATLTAGDIDSPALVYSVYTQGTKGTVSVDSTTGEFTYTPNADANGYDSFVYQVDDGAGGVSTATVTVYIGPVNDAPVFTAGTDQVVDEDAGAQEIAWATGISAGADNESTQELRFVVSADNTSLFAVQPTVSTSGTLVFTPAADVSGTATVSVVLADNGGTANGGVTTSTVQTFTIEVLPVNDAPVFSTGAHQVVAEDSGTQEITNWATGISAGPADESAQTIAFVVSSDNPALFAVQPVVSPAGTLSYTVAAGTGGMATVSIYAVDNGGTANGGVTTSTVQTFTIEVLPVNDAPVFTAGGDQVVDEDTGMQTVSNWATGIDAGAPDEAGQTLHFIVDNSNPSLFAVQPSVSASGTLVYTPADDAFGTATVSVVLADNGGTANGGVTTSTVQTFGITVRPVNDAPVFSTGAGQIVAEDAGLQTVANWATGISAGAANESEQSIEFIASNNNAALFSVQPAVSSTGTLTYTPAANANGEAIVSIYAADNGGTANGGVSTSTVQSFSIVVSAANDAPVAAADIDTVCSDVMRTIAVLANDSDIEMHTLSISSVAQGAKGVAAILPGDTAISYTPFGGEQFGWDSFTYTVIDGNGGSSTATVSMFILPPVEADAGVDTTVCSGSSIRFAGVGISYIGDIRFEWSPATGLSNPFIADPVVQPTTTTTYTLTVTDGFGCSATDQVTVTVVPASATTVSPDVVICSGGSTQLEATGGVGYLWSPAVGLSDTTTAVVTASPTTTTTYTVLIQTAGGCVVSRLVTVTVAPVATADAGADVTVCGGSSVQLSASGGVSYQWSPSTGLSNAFIADPVASPTTTTTYTVTVWSASGCESSDEVTVTVVPAHLDIRVLLEGAYAGASGMSTSLRQQDLVPVEQPYTVSPFNYGGSETLTTTADSVVDWVLVEVRSGVEPGTVVGRKAALLLSDGRIVESSGEALEWTGLSGVESYHVVVYHRNHLGVMSAESVSATGCVLSYDFRLSSASAYEQFMSAQKELETGAWGMVSGDADANGIVNASDRVLVRNESGVLGYRATDLSLDGIVNAVDRVISRNNTFRTSQVP